MQGNDLQNRGAWMSEDGRQPGWADNSQADGQGSGLPEDAPVERIISDSDAAREVAADVPEDDPELEYKLSVYRYEEQPEDAFAPVDYSRKGETPAAPRSGRSVGDYLTIILLVGIPIAIAAILLAVNQSNQQTAQQSAAALPTPRPVFYADQLAIVGQNVNTLADGTVTVDITLANKGQDNVQTVNLLVRLLDDKGGQVGNSGIITIQGIAPGAIGKGHASIKPPATFAKADILISSVQTDHQPTVGIAPSPTAVGQLA
jgi:hypothetical protein